LPYTTIRHLFRQKQ